VDDVRRIDDPRDLRALAHPLRIALLAALRHHGPATATRLAARFDETTGATSYHLRQLARHGFVEEDEGRGSGRERWWRAVHRGTAWRTTDLEADGGGRAAAEWLQRQQAQLVARTHEDWIARQFEAAPAWRAVADSSDYRLRLTPDALSAMSAELHEVIRRHRAAGDGAPDAPEAADVFVGLLAVPLPPDTP